MEHVLKCSRDAAAAYARVKGPDDVLTGNAKLGLGRTLTELGRFGEAEKELLEADRVLRAATGVPPERLKQSAESVAKMYEAWEKAEPGKGYGEKAAEWRGR